MKNLVFIIYFNLNNLETLNQPILIYKSENGVKCLKKQIDKMVSKKRKSQ